MEPSCEVEGKLEEEGGVSWSSLPSRLWMSVIMRPGFPLTLRRNDSSAGLAVLWAIHHRPQGINKVAQRYYHP